MSVNFQILGYSNIYQDYKQYTHCVHCTYHNSCNHFEICKKCNHCKYCNECTHQRIAVTIPKTRSCQLGSLAPLPCIDTQVTQVTEPLGITPLLNNSYCTTIKLSLGSDIAGIPPIVGKQYIGSVVKKRGTINIKNFDLSKNHLKVNE